MIQSIWKASNANSNHSNQIWRIQMQILIIWKAFEAFECKFEPFEKDSSVRIQIRTIQKGFEAFECKFELFERDSKHSNANSNTLNEIRSIEM